MKLLIVRAAEISTWGSCKVISPNLQATYQRLADRFTLSWFDISTKYMQEEIESSRSPLLDLIQKIKMEKPDRLVFVDHLPNPAEILNRLSLFMDLSQLPPIVFHLYGDFTYFSREWSELSPKLANHPVKFLTASHSQERFFNSFCESTNTTEKFFFPVDASSHFFDGKMRTQLRKEHRIGDQETIILYSGRISLQKNVDLLIKEFFKLQKNTTQSLHLWIVGAFDDMGAPFMGVNTDEGYLFSKINDMLMRQPKELTSKIKFWGLKNKEELRAFHSAADTYMSLSLYHDEDYGMSPAEALATGLPALLTDWGGYSSFVPLDKKAWRCQLVPVAITEFGHQLKTSSLKDFFETYNDCYINAVDRERWSNEFLKQFSIEAAQLPLESFLKNAFSKFNGFNWKLAPLAELYEKTNSAKTINVNSGPSNKNFYYEAYKNYISEESNRSEGHHEIVQWMYDYIRNSDVDLVTERRAEKRSYHDYLRPFSKRYYSPANAALLFDGRITNKLREKKLCLLRDGLIPLCLFFREHSPSQFTGHIAVSSQLWYMIPDQWREKVLFYETEAQNEFSRVKVPSKLFITGMLNSTLCDQEEFENHLKYLAETIGKENLSHMEILAYFPNKKKNLWGKWSEETLLKYSNLLYQYLGNKIHFSLWEDLQTETNFHDCLYYECNSGHFIQDSYLKHFVLSRGGTLLHPLQKEISGEIVHSYPLSLYHSVIISRPDFSKLPAYKNPFSSEFLEAYKNMYGSNTKSSEASTSWDSWFASYLKKYYKLFPPSLP